MQRTNAMGLGLGAALMVGLAATPPAQAQEVIDMTVISGHPPAVAVVRYISEFFIPEVDRRLAETGTYQINWTEAYAGSVARPPAVFEAIQDGIADMGHVFMGLEGATMPMEAITYVTPFGSFDLVAVLESVQDLRDAVPAMSEEYARYNQVMIAMAGVDTYSILSVDPVESLADLDGMRIGLPASTARWLEGTGAVAVSGDLTQYYNALQTGVYDGILVFTSGILPCRCYEVAPHLLLTDVGAMFSAVLSVNKDRWDALPEEVRQVFLEVGAEYTVVVAEDRMVAGERAAEIVRENGGTVASLPDEERAAWAAGMENIAREWAVDLDGRGYPGSEILNAYLAVSAENGITFARDWAAE